MYFLQHSFHFNDRGYRPRLIERFDIIFELRNGGNVMTKAHLRELQDIEDHTFGQFEFQQKFCLTEEHVINGSHVPMCRKPMSILRLFDGTFEQEGFPLDSDFQDISARLWQARSAAATRDIMAMCMPTYTNYESAEKVTSNATRLAIFFGGPVKGFKSFGRFYKEQLEVLHTYYLENWVPKLKRWYDDGVDPSGATRILYGTSEIGNQEAKEKTYDDLVWCAMSILAVVTWMALQMQSIFISVMTSYCMFSVAFISNLIYRLIFPNSIFGIIHLFSVIIQFAVTSDQIFVFHDTWRDSQHFKFLSLAHRLSFCFSKISYSTMAVTLLSLIITAVGSFPATNSYGRFAFLQFVLNIGFMATMLPTIVLYYHLHYEQYPFFFCCGRKEEAAVLHNYYDSDEDIPVTEVEIHPTDVEKQLHPEAESRTELHQEVYLTEEEMALVPKRNAAVTHFLEYHHGVISHPRYKWIVLGVVVSIFLVVLTTMLFAEVATTQVSFEGNGQPFHLQLLFKA